MAIAYLALTLLVTMEVNLGLGQDVTTTDSTKSLSTIFDPKRRNDLVDETFLEQKDILLNMLESKLKEVVDKKKKKSDHNIIEDVNNVKCEIPPNNVDLKIKANGISAVGETDVLLKFGRSGNSTLDMDATGISNVGRAQLQLGVGEGSFQIPGLSNLFSGRWLQRNCEQQALIVQNEFNGTKLTNDTLDVRDETNKTRDGRRADYLNNNGTLQINIVANETESKSVIEPNINVQTAAVENATLSDANSTNVKEQSPPALNTGAVQDTNKV